MENINDNNIIINNDIKDSKEYILKKDNNLHNILTYSKL